MTSASSSQLLDLARENERLKREIDRLHLEAARLRQEIAEVGRDRLLEDAHD